VTLGSTKRNFLKTLQPGLPRSVPRAHARPRQPSRTLAGSPASRPSPCAALAPPLRAGPRAPHPHARPLLPATFGRGLGPLSPPASPQHFLSRHRADLLPASPGLSAVLGEPDRAGKGEPHGRGRGPGSARPVVPAGARDGGGLAQVGTLALGRAAPVVRARPGAEDHVRGAPGPRPGGGRLAPGRATAPADLQRRSERQVQPQLGGRPVRADPAHQQAGRRGPAGAPAAATTAAARAGASREPWRAAPPRARRSSGSRPVCQTRQASHALQGAAGDPERRGLQAAGSPEAAAAGVSAHPGPRAPVAATRSPAVAEGGAPRGGWVGLLLPAWSAAGRAECGAPRHFD
jgi:hypothetical protein